MSKTREQAREAAWERYKAGQPVWRLSQFDYGFDAGADWQAEADTKDSQILVERLGMLESLVQQLVDALVRTRDTALDTHHDWRCAAMAGPRLASNCDCERGLAIGDSDAALLAAREQGFVSSEEARQR